ncbi:MAG: hypothetical protein COA62_14665 [Rhodobiaceae bacterium]|nr:MAG: hypothetical protein COA62_14665 [Rhodobiaceae bacterium]
MDKRQTMRAVTVLWGCLSLTAPAVAADFEFTGYLEPELQAFPNKGNVQGQKRWNSSVALELTFEAFWEKGDQYIVFTPFGRLDAQDGNRSHADIRELKYAYIQGDWEFRIGFDKVFWGVTEVAHLVDIINQTDTVESIDGEEKLGQPMVAISTVQDFGVFDFYLLPYFRERTFPSMSGRPAFDIPVDETLTTYESDDKRQHLDFAVRYSNTFEDWDVGVSYFQGTSRDPILLPTFNGPGSLVLAPFYAQIRQASIDVQATKGAWLYKFEGFVRRELKEEHVQATGGIEYTLYRIFESSSDVGIVAEYIWDDRGANARNIFANDAVLGLRWTPNDTASTAVLLATTVDMETKALGLSLEAERRFGNDYFASLEARFFENIPASDPLFSFSNDDFIQLRVARYF